MAQRVGILNGSNLMQDKDVGTLIDVLTPITTGLILNNDLVVSTNSVAIGKCLIHCTRTSTTPNETVWVVFENTSAVTIDTSGTKKVYIEVTQANINDGTLNIDPTGVGIATIKTGASYPSSNYIPLASITGGVITDDRPTTTIGSHIVQGILKLSLSASIASATTTNLATLTGNTVHVTGNVAITGFGTLPAGTEICLIFDGTPTLTYNATSMKLPTNANIIVAAGDIAYFKSEGSGNWTCSSYQRRDWTTLWPVPVVWVSKSSYTAGEAITAGNAVGFNYYREVYPFTGTTIDTAKWTTSWSASQNGYAQITSGGNVAAFINQWKSVATYNESIEMVADLYASYNNAGWLNPPAISELCIYFDATNHIKFNVQVSQGAGTSYVQIVSTKAGVAEYSANSASFGWGSTISKTIKVTFNKTTGAVNLYYKNGTVWTQVGVQRTTTFGAWAFNVVFTMENTNGSANTFVSQMDNYTLWLLGSKKLVQCNASDPYRLSFNWFATWNATIGGSCQIDTAGVSSTQSWLTVWSDYYLSNTPGWISTTPWTYFCRVWQSLSATDLEIDTSTGYKTQPIISPTVGASPYTYQNTTGKQTIASITGGTVSAVQISRDNSTFYKTAAATNTFVVLAPLDYVNITYTVAPVISLFTF